MFLLFDITMDLALTAYTYCLASIDDNFEDFIYLCYIELVKKMVR